MSSRGSIKGGQAARDRCLYQIGPGTLASSCIPPSIPINAPNSADGVSISGLEGIDNRSTGPRKALLRERPGWSWGSAQPPQDMLWWGLMLEKVLEQV